MSSRQHDEPPLPDFDHLPVGSLGHRIRSLTAGKLGQLMRYEREHADRRPVTELFRARLNQLHRGSGPSPGGTGAHPDPPGRAPGGSRVGPETASGPVHPPPHGTPTDLGRPKADRP